MMRRFFCVVLLLLAARWSLAAPAAAGSLFDLTSVPVGQVVSLYLKEVAQGPYLACNEVLNDTRMVSIRASGKTLDKAVFGVLLDSFGYSVRVEDGVTVICKGVAAGGADESVFVYRPYFRDASYLVDFLSPLFHGSFANKRAQQGAALAVGGAAVGPAGGGAAVPSAGGPAAGVSGAAPGGAQAVGQRGGMGVLKPSVGDDFIVYTGSDADIKKLEKLLRQIDVPTGEVVVKGYVYEVGTNESDATALDLFLSVLGGKVSVLSHASSLGNAVRLKTASLDVIASELKTDGRFRVVTSPFTRVRSGGTARFVVGNEVPVLGAIVTTQGGATQQSVEYRSAGMIFEVSPRVREASTDVDLFQQVSTFVNTDTGVNGSPTLNKRELRTSLSLDDGEVIVIGGLTDSKTERASNGLSFLPFSLSRSNASRNSELLLVLELKRI